MFSSTILDLLSQLNFHHWLGSKFIASFSIIYSSRRDLQFCSNIHRFFSSNHYISIHKKLLFMKVFVNDPILILLFNQKVVEYSISIENSIISLCLYRLTVMILLHFLMLNLFSIIRFSFSKSWIQKLTHYFLLSAPIFPINIYSHPFMTIYSCSIRS